MTPDQKKYILSAIIVLVIIMLFLNLNEFSKLQENLENRALSYSSQIASKAIDPTQMFYKGRQRDALGMSRNDYYLENDMLARNYAQDYLHFNDDAYYNQNDYKALPKEYRPKTATRFYTRDKPDQVLDVLKYKVGSGI